MRDSKQAVAFLREVIDGLRARYGRRLSLEFRMDPRSASALRLELLRAR